MPASSISFFHSALSGLYDQAARAASASLFTTVGDAAIDEPPQRRAAKRGEQ